MMRLIIFDFDGTLVDSQDMIVAAYKDAAKIQKLHIPKKSTILKTIGLSLKESLREIFSRLNDTKEIKETVRRKIKKLDFFEKLILLSFSAFKTKSFLSLNLIFFAEKD